MDKWTDGQMAHFLDVWMDRWMCAQYEWKDRAAAALDVLRGGLGCSLVEVDWFKAHRWPHTCTMKLNNHTAETKQRWLITSHLSACFNQNFTLSSWTQSKHNKADNNEDLSRRAQGITLWNVFSCLWTVGHVEQACAMIKSRHLIGHTSSHMTGCKAHHGGSLEFIRVIGQTGSGI